MGKHPTLRLSFGRRASVLDWVLVGLLVKVVAIWVGLELRKLWAAIAEIPISYL